MEVARKTVMALEFSVQKQTFRQLLSECQFLEATVFAGGVGRLPPHTLPHVSGVLMKEVHKAMCILHPHRRSKGKDNLAESKYKRRHSFPLQNNKKRKKSECSEFRTWLWLEYC